MFSHKSPRLMLYVWRNSGEFLISLWMVPAAFLDLVVPAASSLRLGVFPLLPSSVLVASVVLPCEFDR